MRNAEKEKILLTSTNIWFFAEGMLGPLLAIFAERFGGDIFDITWAWAIFLIVTGSLTLIIGHIADKKEGFTAKLMFIGYIVNMIFTFGFLFVDSAYKLFIVEAGLGVAAALATPTWDSLYAKYENKRKPTLAWCTHEGLYRIVTAIGIVIGGFIVSYYSFKVLFITMGILQIIAVIVQGFMFWKHNRLEWKDGHT